MRYLHRLPSELDLTDTQVRELLAYHHLQGRSQNICPDCIEAHQSQEKECFLCKSIFSDKAGMLRRAEGGRREASDSERSRVLAAVRRSWGKKKDKPDKDQPARRQKIIEKMKKAGIVVLGE